MQLSIFGNTMNNNIWGSQSFSSKVKITLSRSYPRVPSNEGRTLVSVISEGSTSVRAILKGKATTSHLSSRTKQSRVMADDSSDESGAEGKHIMRIDLLSTLSFPQAP